MRLSGPSSTLHALNTPSAARPGRLRGGGGSRMWERPDGTRQSSRGGGQILDVHRRFDQKRDSRPVFFGSNSSADYHRDTDLLTQHDLTRVPLFRVASRTGAATRTQNMKLKKKTKNLTSFIPPSTPMVGFDQLPGGEKKRDRT